MDEDTNLCDTCIENQKVLEARMRGVTRMYAIGPRAECHHPEQRKARCYDYIKIEDD
jgi:hypothetical protein